MVPASAVRYRFPMRVNVLAVGVLSLAAGAMRAAVSHDYWMGGALAAMGVWLIVLHFVRLRRFKRFDDAKNLD